jgi:hypothetical protein
MPAAAWRATAASAGNRERRLRSAERHMCSGPSRVGVPDRRLGMPTGAVGICGSTRAECPFGRPVAWRWPSAARAATSMAPTGGRACTVPQSVGLRSRPSAPTGSLRDDRADSPLLPAALQAASGKPCLRGSHRSRCLVGRPGNRLARTPAAAASVRPTRCRRGRRSRCAAPPG